VSGPRTVDSDLSGVSAMVMLDLMTNIWGEWQRVFCLLKRLFLLLLLSC
jgi:hypothetical protein